MCAIFAFTTILLAEAYSINFLGPIFVVILSIAFLKETVSGKRWVLLAMSFIGVLLVVRPASASCNWGTSPRWGPPASAPSPPRSSAAWLPTRSA